MEKVLDLSTGCATFKGSGGELFAVGGPTRLAALEANKPREQDDDSVNFAKRPRTNEDGVRCTHVNLQRAELCEFLETTDNKTLAISLKATHVSKTTWYWKVWGRAPHCRRGAKMS